MANIVLYNPSDPDVANRVTEYRPSAHTPDYDGVLEKLVNPDLTSVANVPMQYWKVDGNDVVEMTQNEKDIVTPDITPGTYEHIHLRRNKTRDDSFSRVGSYIYEGSDRVGIPLEVTAIGYVDVGVTGEVRLFDKSNHVVIGSATVTNTTEDEILLSVHCSPTLWPTGRTIIEVQAKRTAGTGKQFVYIDSMKVGI